MSLTLIGMAMRILVLAVLLAGCAPTPAPEPRTTPRGRMGVLVMAHGGSDDWNHTVLGAVAPLAAELPTAVAFGMADPGTLAPALDSLASLGVDRVAVVRLFVSGQSFLARTREALGMSAEPEGARPRAAEEATARRPVAPIAHRMAIATHEDGLAESAEARRILSQRALSLSHDPARESVLLLAHGMGSDAEDRELHEALARLASELGHRRFAAVRVETLREDWPDERSEAEARIRSFVAAEGGAGRRVLVIPVRLSGFGPYAEVLSGLDYVAGEGLLPHREISTWIRGRAQAVACARGWHGPLGGCG